MHLGCERTKLRRCASGHRASSPGAQRRFVPFSMDCEAMSAALELESMGAWRGRPACRAPLPRLLARE